jgi:trimeric autotransporter adhesin
VVTGVSAGTATITATSEGVNGTADITVTTVPVASVSVTLNPTSIQVGATSTGSAVTRDASNNVLTGRTVTWASSNTSVATVSGSGVVTGVSAGTATITATSEGINGTADITVTAVPVSSVSVTLNPTSIQVGATSTGSAVTRDASNNVLTGRTVTWASSNTSVATVNGSGVVTGVSAGSATITATSEGINGTADITVTAIPVDSVEATLADSSIAVAETVQAAAITRAAGGAVLTGRTITWASSNTSVATVNSSGLVTALDAGTATSEGKSDGVSLTITAVPVASVTVTLNPTSIQVGATSTGSAVTRDASNNVLTGRTVTWGSSNTSVATVNGSGLVTGVSAGTATITATSEGINGTADITVTAIPVDSVEATLADSTIAVGQTSQGAAITRAAGGAVLTGRTITWASSNTSVATVNSSGLVTALDAGTVTITATSEGKSDGVSLTITVVPVASVNVTLNPTSIQVGATSTGSAVTRDASNNVLTGRTVTWGSSNTSVATVNGSGLVTGVSAGTATITATSEGINGTADITVTAIPVDSVEATLADSSIAVAETVQAAAITRAAGGAVLTGRTITWASSNTSIATVNSSGLVTALDAGTVTITATSEGKSDDVSLVIVAAVGASVAVTLEPTTIQVGETSTGTAVTREAGKSMPTGRAVKWTSGDTAVATVTSNGVVTGVSSGSATITATSQGVDGSADITVTAMSEEVLEVAYSELRILVGQSSPSLGAARNVETAGRLAGAHSLSSLPSTVLPGAMKHP